MRTEYSFDGEDWSPNADAFGDLKKIGPGLIPYVFDGEYNIFNQFDGPLVDYVRQSDFRINFVFNGIWDLRGPYPMIQINCANKRDEVVFRLRIWI